MPEPPNKGLAADGCHCGGATLVPFWQRQLGGTARVGRMAGAAEARRWADSPEAGGQSAAALPGAKDLPAREGPYRFFFYSNEGTEPAHVHVQRDRSLAKFWLRPVALASSIGFSGKELRELEAIVREHQAEFEGAWNDFFGAKR